MNFRRFGAKFCVESRFVMVEISSFRVSEMGSLDGYDETEPDLRGAIPHVRSFGASGATHSRLLPASFKVGLNAAKLWPEETS
jgi:hypothetical protein